MAETPHNADLDPTCKHCGLPLGGVSGEGPRYYVHTEGPQRGLRTCAITPYGFNAEPVGAECERICNGSRGIEPERLNPPVQSCCPGAGTMAHVRGCANHPEADR